MLLVDIAGVQKDNERLKAAHESATKLQAFREEDLRKLNSDLAGIKKERQAIERHLAQVEQHLAKGRELLAETLRRNSEMAERLRARQLQSGESGSTPPAAVSGPLALENVN